MTDTTAGTVVSIVVPYAGSAALLRETVRSVLDQSDDQWRLTVVEDGDQDPGVAAYVRGLADPRVRYEKNASRLGVAGNFQRCLDLAETDLVVLPGSDDRLLPDYVATVRDGVRRHPEVAVVQPGVRVIGADGLPARPAGDRVKGWLRPATSSGEAVVSGEPLLRSLMTGNWTYFPSICWRREVLAERGFRQDLATVLDLEALAQVVLRGGRMLLLDEVVFEYRRHHDSASSLSAVSAARFEEERSVMDELAAAASARGWTSAARASVVRGTSRLHAATLLPAAVSARRWTAVRTLARHALGR